jgi:transcriptional regulator with XRE-family HTH domain
MVDPALFHQRDRVRRSRPLLRTTLGEVLRRTRRGQGRTLADVARAARVSMPYLSELERGRKEASSEVLAAICDALGIELADLLAEIGRDLADRRVRRPAVIRLDSARDGLAPPQLPGSADALHRQERAIRGSGDPVCLLAA